VSPLLRVSLTTGRRSTIGWGIGIAAVAVVYSAFYPSISSSAADLNKYMQNLPDAVKTIIGNDYTSPAGYLRAEFFSLLGPILLLAYTIGGGAKAVAGEEESRSLDLLLSTPLSRGRVVADKATSLLVTTLAITVFSFLVIIVVGPPFDLSVPVADVAADCVMFLLLGLTFGSLALAVGCLTGRRTWAIAVAGVIGVATYLLNAIAPTVTALSWARPLSPFRWYLEPDPLTTGLHPENVLVLGAVTAVFTGVAAWGFRRRDLAA
jgi:ABC-2 type transport system permease protein